MKYFVAFLASITSSLVVCACFQYIWNTYVTILGAIPLGYWQAYGVSLLASWAAIIFAVFPRQQTGDSPTSTALVHFWSVLMVKTAYVLYIWGVAYIVSFFI